MHVSESVCVSVCSACVYIYFMCIIHLFGSIWYLCSNVVPFFVYLEVHIPNICKVKAPPNELQNKKKNAKWVWTEEYQKIFNELKDMLTSDLYLTHFNPKL